MHAISRTIWSHRWDIHQWEFDDNLFYIHRPVTLRSSLSMNDNLPFFVSPSQLWMFASKNLHQFDSLWYDFIWMDLQSLHNTLYIEGIDYILTIGTAVHILQWTVPIYRAHNKILSSRKMTSGILNVEIIFFQFGQILEIKIEIKTQLIESTQLNSRGVCCIRLSFLIGYQPPTQHHNTTHSILHFSWRTSPLGIFIFFSHEKCCVVLCGRMVHVHVCICKYILCNYDTTDICM